MDLTSFIREGTLIPVGGGGQRPLSISIDSRTVEKGGLFIAIPGFQQDGSLFIEEALRRGANTIVVPQGMGKKVAAIFQEPYPLVSFFEAPEIRKVASLLASRFYPLQPDTVVAVTGTNGKTSVVSFMRQIWHHLGVPAASLGTLGLRVEGRSYPPPTGTDGLNTPDSVRLHHLLQTLKEQRIEHVAFEASSHGLHQHRLDAVRLKAAVFTNFSNDHLDYHQTMDAYFEAKCRLFQEVISCDTYAILNADRVEYERLLAICTKRHLPIMTFGKAGKTIQLTSITSKADGQEVGLCVEGKPDTLLLPLVGQFQVYNVMAALGAVMACGGDASQAIDACRSLKSVPGRLEQAAPGIYVDYSHKPEALSSALQALRPHTKGHLWVVFGCGGNRDAFKRPLMGDIAAQLADHVIITDDNPRYEDPAAIRQQILAKCPQAREIPSRREAISTVLEERQEDDVVLIAGKGHETHQLVGDQALPFNDGEEVRRYRNR
jgi:UDP-N-acetylmuramoyl-L-alanyl-D-glutamate--2,6-diaminopimelate ligase